MAKLQVKTGNALFRYLSDGIEGEKRNEIFSFLCIIPFIQFQNNFIKNSPKSPLQSDLMSVKDSNIRLFFQWKHIV